MKLRYVYIVFFVCFLSSCLKEEVPVPYPLPGKLNKVVIEIGYPYLNQVYYNCNTNCVVSTNTKYDWDLSFECSENGFHVLLNNATGMLLANMQNVNFSNLNSTNGAKWLWDAPSGNLDSTAFGNWINKNNVYIIDRQYNDNGQHRGYYKFELINVSNNNYTFKFAKLNETEGKTFVINKHRNISFIHFSVDNGGVEKQLEPDKNKWDLLFTNHHHKFDNLIMPFVLTQVLINKHYNVVAAEDNANNFLNITLKDTANYVFTNNWDEIGHDWKIRNSTDNSFTIDAKKSFLVKSSNGLFYKIQFTDFYNDKGEKGNPTFNIQKL